MTLNLIFVTVTIKKRKKSTESYLHEALVNEIYEQSKQKQTDLFIRNY